jgi:hypothetical protein
MRMDAPTIKAGVMGSPSISQPKTTENKDTR